LATERKITDSASTATLQERFDQQENEAKTATTNHGTVKNIKQDASKVDEIKHQRSATKIENPTFDQSTARRLLPASAIYADAICETPRRHRCDSSGRIVGAEAIGCWQVKTFQARHDGSAWAFIVDNACEPRTRYQIGC
jgi:hypothetical protein